MRAFVLRLVRYGVSPVFLLMAVISYIIEHHGGGHAHMAGMAPMAHDSSLAGWLAASGLGSMWIMYVLMALAHVSPWLKTRGDG